LDASPSCELSGFLIGCVAFLSMTTLFGHFPIPFIVHSWLYVTTPPMALATHASPLGQVFPGATRVDARARTCGHDLTRRATRIDARPPPRRVSAAANTQVPKRRECCVYSFRLRRLATRHATPVLTLWTKLCCPNPTVQPNAVQIYPYALNPRTRIPNPSP